MPGICSFPSVMRRSTGNRKISHIVPFLILLLLLLAHNGMTYALHNQDGVHDPSAIVKCDDTYWIFGTGHGPHATRSSPGKADASPNRMMCTLEPKIRLPLPEMERGITYYWKVDEVNSSGTTAGEIWSFTADPAPPVGIPVESTLPVHELKIYPNPADRRIMVRHTSGTGPRHPWNRLRLPACREILGHASQSNQECMY